MEYEDFELQVGPLSDEGLHVRVRSPAGEGEELIQLPNLSGDPELLLGALRHLKAEASGLSSSPVEIGSDLFQSVFAGQIGSLFYGSLGQIEVPLRGLRIRLRINPRDRTLAPFLGLPWELLYRKDTEEFLALNQRTPIVRALAVPQPATLRPYQPPLRILAVLARDPESSPLSLEEELEQLRESLEQNPEIRLKALEDPDTQTIRKALDQEAFHILHYMGHGAFEPETGEGALLFSGPEGRLPVTGRHLATKVRGLDALRMVVLNACETGVVGGETAQGPFAGVAAALVLGGIPAVVAMQSSIRDAHSLAFTSAFYKKLAGGTSVEEAVTEGRQAIHSFAPNSASWAIPILFQRAGDLFAQDRRAVPAPEIQVPPRPTRQGGRGLPTRALLLGLLVIALGAGLIHWLGDGLASLRDNKATIPPATQPEKRSKEPDPVQQPPPSQKVESAAPSGDPVATKKPRAVPIEGCGLRHVIVGTPPVGFTATLCDETKRLASAYPVAGQTARIEVGPTRCSSSEEEGVSGISCTIEALISLRGGGVSRELSSVSVEGWQPNEARARSTAVEKLAPAVVARIAASL